MDGISANKGYILKCHAEPSRLYRRASVDQITFSNPGWLQVYGPNHPAPTFGRSNLPRNLSYIREISEPVIGNESGTRSHRPASLRNDGGSVAAAVPQLNSRSSTSTLSLPLSSVPERKSSMSVLRGKVSHCLPVPPPRGLGQTVPTRGPSVSPVRLAVTGLEPVSSQMVGSHQRPFGALPDQWTW